MSRQVTAADLTLGTSDQKFRLGTIHETELGDVYRYMQADGAVTVKVLYNFTNAYQIDAPLTTAVVAAGECHSLCSFQGGTALADNEYAWMFVGPGTATLTSVAAIAAQAKIFTAASGGLIDDDSSGEFLIPGLQATTAFASAVTGTVYASCGLYVYN